MPTAISNPVSLRLISYNESITYKHLHPKVNNLTFLQTKLTDSRVRCARA